ncbi:MAG: hypothetical protein H0W46_09235, partial [Acidimicrobiia bacterium]|nr:hypothetical protein [Acidimicrobiia bacterium]
LDWDALRDHHGLEVDVMQQRFPPADHPTFASWRTATQRYQASLLRQQIETLRRLKYRPTGGFCFSWLADPAPMISASVLDHERRPKLAWAAVVEACRPVIVVTDPLPVTVTAGDRLELDVHVVSDLRVAVVDASISVTCTWRGGRRDWAYRGDIAADACTKVATLELTVPDGPGELLLGLALAGRDEDGERVEYARRSGARITPR